MKYFWLFLAQLLILASCSKGESIDDVDYSKDIVGAWYNEYYKEYDCFYSSGVYYCEIHTAYQENSVLSVNGNYKLEGNKCILNYSYDGYETVKSTNIIQSINETTFVCKGTENGETYTFTRVLDEITLEYGEKYIIRNLPFEAKIEKFESLSQGIVASTEQGEVYPIFPGIGYVKVYTDKGNIIIRVIVPNPVGFVLPNLSYVLGVSAEELISLLGPAGLEITESGCYCYYPNNDIVKEFIVYVDETTEKANFFYLELSDEISPDVVIEYLESNYEALQLEDDVMYLTDGNVAIIYEEEDGVLLYMLMD